MRESRTVIAAITGEYLRYKGMAEACFEQLSEAELSRDPDATGNSIATLVWHLSGNLESRFTDFLTADGEKPWREREEEFATRVVTREELTAKWTRGWTVLLDQLSALNDGDLEREVTIRARPLTVIEALQRSSNHVAFHVGQIVLLGKSMRGPDWRYLTIAPGQSEAYNRNPTLDRPPESDRR